MLCVQIEQNGSFKKTHKKNKKTTPNENTVIKLFTIRLAAATM